MTFKLGVSAVLVCLSSTTSTAVGGAEPAANRQIKDSRIASHRIKDILELQRLKALYFYALDHKDWESWRALFVRDAKLLVDRNDDLGDRVDVTEGMDQVMQYVKERLTIPVSVHHGHTPIFEFVSDTEAVGIWAMSDIVDSGSEKVLEGYGHYRETYRKEDGVWKISSVHLTRLKVDITKAGK